MERELLEDKGYPYKRQAVYPRSSWRMSPRARMTVAAVSSVLVALAAVTPAAAETVDVFVTTYQCPTAAVTSECFAINSAAIYGTVAGAAFDLMSVSIDGTSIQAESGDEVVINVVGGPGNADVVNSSFSLAASAGSAVTFVFVTQAIPPDPGGGGDGGSGTDPGGGTGGDPGGGTGGEPGGETGGDSGGTTPGGGGSESGGGQAPALTGGPDATQNRAVVALPNTGAGLGSQNVLAQPTWLLALSAAAVCLALLSRPRHARLGVRSGGDELR